MWWFTASTPTLAQILAPTSVQCDDVRTQVVPSCCHASQGAANLTSLVAQAYGPDTGCPLSEVSLPCDRLNAEFAAAQCCSQTYADVPGWIHDRLPSPTACLQGLPLPEGTVVKRLSKTTSRDFASRNYGVSTTVVSKGRRFMITPMAYLKHPKNVYQSCEDFGLYWGTGKCAWDTLLDDQSGFLYERFLVTDLEGFTQKTVTLKGLVTRNCATHPGCCDAEDVWQCMFLSSRRMYDQTLAVVDLRVHGDYAYFSSVIAAYNRFEGDYATMEDGDSTMYNADLFPWHEAESYLHRIRYTDILDAKDGDRLEPELLVQNVNQPDTVGWGGALMHIEGEVLYTSSALMFPSIRRMAYHLTKGTVSYLPELKNRRGLLLTGKDGKLVFTSMQPGTIQGNFTTDYTKLGSFTMEPTGMAESTMFVAGGFALNHRQMHGDLLVGTGTTGPMLDVDREVPTFEFMPTSYYSEPMRPLETLLKDISQRAGRNVGALQMFDGALTRPQQYLDAQFLKSPKVATYAVDASGTGMDVVYTDGLHVRMPIRLPQGCKSVSNVERPVVDFLGGYRVTKEGEAWFATQAPDLSTLREGDYLSDAQVASASLDAWVQQAYVDTYTSPVHMVTCAALFEMQTLGVEHTHTLGDVLSDKALKAIPESAKGYLRPFAPPFYRYKSKSGSPEYIQLLDPLWFRIGGPGLAQAQGVLYPYSYGSTIYRLDTGEYVHAKPTDGTGYKQYSVLR